MIVQFHPVIRVPDDFVTLNETDLHLSLVPPYEDYDPKYLEFTWYMVSFSPGEMKIQLNFSYPLYAAVTQFI